ncbi:HAD family hydrolase [Micromonospora sp. NPDC001898]|uniref:HAD family hydrolase n=1 Tax=Micromonospora sp. NPDC001898 TaxID=3364221 RepID=UPI0036B99060
MLYDLDGVLLDSTALMAAVLTDVAEAVLRLTPTDVAVAQVLSMPPVIALHTLGVKDPQAAVAEHFDLSYARHAHLATVAPGAVAVLRQLREAGIQQGIVTLQRRRRLQMLDLSSITPLVDTLVCYDDASPKPSPAPIWRALTQLGVPRWQAWYVGDSASDVVAGRAAGVRVAGATWGAHSAAILRHAGASRLLNHPSQIAVLATTDVVGAYPPDQFGAATTGPNE